MLLRIELAHLADRALRRSAATAARGSQQLRTSRSRQHYHHNAIPIVGPRSLLVREAVAGSCSRSFATAAAEKKTTTPTTTTTTKAAKPETAVKKKAAATGGRKKATTTKASAGKAAAKKKPAKKAAKKPVQRPKKAKPKPKPKPKRKVLTEKQKAAQAVKRNSEAVKVLKEKALLKEEPTSKPLTAYNYYIREQLANAPGDTRKHLGEAAARYKTLSSGELEQLNHKVVEAQGEIVTAYQNWVTAHTAREIRDANSARLTLKNLHMAAKKADTKPPHVRLLSLKPIRDDRAPKKPNQAWIFFSVERHTSGDFKNISVAERSKLISKEYSELSAAALQKYKDQASADSQRYAREYKQVFGDDPSSVTKAKAKA